jgi:hypothetical protein
VAGAVTVDILTGTFYLASGAGSDLLSQSAIGQTVYVINETTVGLTSGGGSRPKAGTLFFIDPAPPPTALGAFAVKMVQGGP